jgi:4-amino-4-deoxy-L-arabinose transferase-like glycosyltransferase
VNVLLLGAWSAFLFLYGLNQGELYRTESLRAILAAEMLRSGNWVVPKLYGEPFLSKPPGMYVAITLASWPQGAVTPATARLPSTLAATLAVFLIYWYFRRLFGRQAGFIAALILPASFLWLDRVPSAEIDLLQVTWVTAALLFFLRGLEVAEDAVYPSRPLAVFPWWQTALLCVSGGLLTKWTAPAFFYGTILPLLWWRGRLRLLLGRAHLVSAAVAAALCLAWVGAAVHQASWDAWYGTVRQEALQRISPLHHPRPYPWLELLEHPFTVLAGSLPWSAFALLTLRRGFLALWEERVQRLVQALHCWVWPNLLFWSVVPGHRPRHSLPLTAGLAGLAALVWIGWLTGRLRWPLTRLPPRPALVALLLGWIAVKLAFVHVVVPQRAPGRDLEAKARQLASLVPEDEPLYLSDLKDEGIMFYYGRPVQRIRDLGEWSASDSERCFLLTEGEWKRWSATRRAAVVQRLQDEQGAPIFLIRTGGSDSAGRSQESIHLLE